MTTTPDGDAIRELLARYALCLDVDDYDGCLQLFAEHGQFLVYGKTLTGEQIRRMFIRAPKGMHLTGAAIVAVDGDAATVRSQVLFVDSTTHQTRAALYDDDLEKVDKAWRFRRRRCQFITPYGLLDTPGQR